MSKVGLVSRVLKEFCSTTDNSVFLPLSRKPDMSLKSSGSSISLRLLFFRRLIIAFSSYPPTKMLSYLTSF
jgi:hypothetical protein